jgi:amidase
MQKPLFLVLLVAGFLGPANARQQAASKSLPDSTAPAAGHWVITADYLGTPINLSLELTQNGEKLAGDLDGDKLEGSFTGTAIHFLAKDDHGGSEEVTGSISGDAISGKMILIESSNPDHPLSLSFAAKRKLKPNPGAPQRHEFTPTTFYRQFSPTNKPVLNVSPGDTIHTTTVDAGGTDEKGIARVLGGNPETGPFFVESASPGDTLVIHFTRVRLNRDWAISDDFVVGRALNSGLAVKMKDGGKNIRWHLDTQRGVATPEKPAEHLTHYSVPLKPMLGCVAVATGPASAPPGTGDSGNFGGNMDFNEIVEGATVYLPVSISGALLYVGDGHAAQGDGELTGNALETSMDVEFTVDVLPSKRVPGPRVESSTHFMAMGLSGSIDDAFREATSNMAQWLADEYKLTPSEVAQVLGTSAEYKVSEVADRNVGVVLKINKERLQPLK